MLEEAPTEGEAIVEFGEEGVLEEDQEGTLQLHQSNWQGRARHALAGG